MAYFSNSSDGMKFDEQCSKCKLGELPCPIALVQNEYNYSACNNVIASEILNYLVKDTGVCSMFKFINSVKRD